MLQLNSPLSFYVQMSYVQLNRGKKRFDKPGNE